MTGAQFAHNSSNFLLEKQNMQLSRNPPDDLGLRWHGLVGAKFEATGPKILGGRRIGDPDIDAKDPGTSALGAARYKIFNIGLGSPRRGWPAPSPRVVMKNHDRAA